MAKLANQMTRVVAIGTLKEYNYTTEGFVKGTGNLDIGDGSNARFTIFNNEREGATNPHTKAKDFSEIFKPGDKVYVTGQDNRSPNEAGDRYFEDISTWDFREANEDEINRWVFVYVMDVKEIDTENKQLTLSFTNYKKKEILYFISYEKANLPAGLEAGDRIKVKGTIWTGRKEDFYGDGEFITERRAAEIQVLNTKAEVEEATSTDGSTDESKLW